MYLVYRFPSRYTLGTNIQVHKGRQVPRASTCLYICIFFVLDQTSMDVNRMQSHTLLSSTMAIASEFTFKLA